MAGHSKWANIRHRKARQDAKKGKNFSRLLRELRGAARQGGQDPACNPRLRTLMDKALALNMTRDVIQRALSSSEKNEEETTTILYEGYGPEGAALLVECVTDNRNRTASEVRHAFAKHGGRVAKPGEVVYLFTQQGVVLLPEGSSATTFLDKACAAGAEELEEESGRLVITTSPAQLNTLLNALGDQVESYELAWMPRAPLSISETAQHQLTTLIEQLEGLEDVETVYHNIEWA